jgi:excisionase family DNA binding protein
MYSINEVAERLNTTPRTVIRRIDEGDIPSYKIGKLVRIRKSDFDAYLERSRRMVTA